MTIEKRYAVKRYGEIAIICESRDDAILLAHTFTINDEDILKYVVEIPYLADYNADDDDDEDSIHVVLLRHAHDNDGDDSDD